MTAKEPGWDRRKEDANVRGEVVKTLGSVQTAITLFEKSLEEAKARFERRIEELADQVQEHEELLNGTAKEEGFFQWMHQADRNIKALIMGVLGESGANYEKSIKGKLDKAIGDISELRARFEAQQVTSKVQLDSLIATRTHRTTLRGQNVLLVVAVIGMIGAITAAAVKEWQPALWARILHRPVVIATATKNHAPRTRRGKRRVKVPMPTVDAPAPAEAVKSQEERDSGAPPTPSELEGQPSQ